jgi:hypothetical protein
LARIAGDQRQTGCVANRAISDFGVLSTALKGLRIGPLD